MTQATLHITNGDSAVDLMRAIELSGEFLPWRDVLHAGPVPAGLSLEELSRVRAEYISGLGWGEPTAIAEDFAARDRMLEQHARFDKVMLWFESDLYDQLQILQILDWFAEQEIDTTRVSMICTEHYLGECTPGFFKTLQRFEQPVSAAQLSLARKAWAAFRAPTPQSWFDLLAVDTSALPFLQDAVVRMLEEYPAVANGLSRTAQQALTIIAAGETGPGRIFGLYQRSEERRFLGDSSFWLMLNELLQGTQPLLRLSNGKRLQFPIGPEQKLTMTEMGEQVLQRKRDWLQLSNINCWLGGVHLSANDVWRFDAQRCALHHDRSAA